MEKKDKVPNSKRIHFFLFGVVLLLSVILVIACGGDKRDEKPRLLLNNSNMTMKVGDSINLEAFYEEDRDTAEVTWSTDNISVVTVTNNGKADAVGKGQAVITAMDKNGVQAKCDISVKDVEVENVQLNKVKASVKIKESIQLQAELYPAEASNKDIQWITEDDDIAVVNSSGLVTGKKEGVINIICRSSNGKEASCTVTVKNSMESAETDQMQSQVQYDNIQDTYDYGPEPFYGIWIGASKKESDAEKKAETFRDKGLDAQVFITTNWSNLNKEKWYVITAGVYNSKSEAKDYLPGVKKICSDAYIKYSGEWKE